MKSVAPSDLLGQRTLGLAVAVALREGQAQPGGPAHVGQPARRALH